MLSMCLDCLPCPYLAAMLTYFHSLYTFVPSCQCALAVGVHSARHAAVSLVFLGSSFKHLGASTLAGMIVMPESLQRYMLLPGCNVTAIVQASQMPTLPCKCSALVPEQLICREGPPAAHDVDGDASHNILEVPSLVVLSAWMLSTIWHGMVYKLPVDRSSDMHTHWALPTN
jgi:hypothetical protein